MTIGGPLFLRRFRPAILSEAADGYSATAFLGKVEGIYIDAPSIYTTGRSSFVRPLAKPVRLPVDPISRDGNRRMMEMVAAVR